jgi:hypothetical protein
MKQEKKGKGFSFRRHDLYLSSATAIEHYTWIERMELVNPRKLTCLSSGWRKSSASRPDLNLQPRRGRDRDSRRGDQQGDEDGDGAGEDGDGAGEDRAAPERMGTATERTGRRQTLALPGRRHLWTGESSRADGKKRKRSKRFLCNRWQCG